MLVLTWVLNSTTVAAIQLLFLDECSVGPLLGYSVIVPPAPNPSPIRGDLTPIPKRKSLEVQ